MLPTALNVGSGKDFRDDHLNIDCNGYWKPDIVADLGKPLDLDRVYETERFGPVMLVPGRFKTIVAHEVLEHVSDLVTCMTTCLTLLAPGGIMDVTVPYDLSYGAWQDPTHVRAFNEKSWLYYTDWHWYLGWEEARFVLELLDFVPSSLGTELKRKGLEMEEIVRTPRAIDTMRVRLRKAMLTEQGRIEAGAESAETGQAPDLDRFCIWIVSPADTPHHHAVDEVAFGLSAAFQRLGGQAPIVRDPRAIGSRRPIVFCAHLLDSTSRLPEDAIIFNLEQITPPVLAALPGYLERLKGHEVWEYSQTNLRQLESLGVPRRRFCGIGYVPELERIVPQPEDIDVLFYGAENERRKRVLDELREAGVNVVSAFGVYGSERDALIARSRIVLNMHFYESRVFEIVRVAYLLANRRFVVSEVAPGNEYESALRGGVAFSSYRYLARTCQKFLRDRERREAIAQEGYARIRTLPQEDLVRNALFESP